VQHLTERQATVETAACFLMPPPVSLRSPSSPKSVLGAQRACARMGEESVSASATRFVVAW
jgi:hypothetical protein